MDILLCWSKERSKLVARALHEWLPKVVPGVKPWMSDIDLDKRKDWFNQLHDFFGQARAAVVFITPENVRSPWIYYESGQIAGRLVTNLVCPFPLEEQPSILSDGPLGRIQATKAGKEDTLILLRTLNKNLGNKAIPQPDLDVNFEREWWSIGGTLARLAEMRVDLPKLESFISTEIDQLAGGNLSSEERTILLHCGQDQQGTISHYVTSGGDHFRVNGQEFNVDNTPRSTARWRAALKSLVQRRLLEMRGSKGQVFALTAKGFEVFDALRSASDK